MTVQYFGGEECEGARASVPHFGAGLRVLVAEEDNDLRERLARTLRHDGYEVVEAKNGLDLLDQIAPLLASEQPHQAIDVIIADVRMPCFTGLEILTDLVVAERKPTVIVITAPGDPSTRARARRLGALAIMDKPFDIDDLRTVLFNLR
jgi:two-component system, response regulator, stage 0 sporulation protein F